MERGRVMTGKLVALFPETPIKLLKIHLFIYIWPTCDRKVLGKVYNSTMTVRYRMSPIVIRHDGPSAILRGGQLLCLSGPLKPRFQVTEMGSARPGKF